MARASGRYTLDKFGIQKGTLRTLAGWLDARQRGELRVKYLGEKKIDALGGRLCFCFHRHYVRPDPNGADDLLVYVDAQTWLQTGTKITDRDGNVIGEYYFRDVKINPVFDPKQFEPSAVAP